MKKQLLTISLLSIIAAETIHEQESITVVGETLVDPVQRVAVVDTVGRFDIERNPESNLIDLLDGKPGVRKKVDCSVCNTAQIRLLGLNGAYAQVLIDGLPLFSGLGTVYGIEQIPLVTVERIDVIKGSSGVQHGNNAIAGVINIVHGPISSEPNSYLKMSYGHHNEQNYEGAFSTRVNGSSTGLQVALNYNSSPQINMDDSPMIDVAEFDRVGFSARLSHWIGSNMELTARANGSFEDRFGGTETSGRTKIGSYLPDSTWVNEWGETQHQKAVYQEYVRSRRVNYETGLRTQISDNLKNETRISYLQHFQESWYGYLDLIALQDLFFMVSDFTLDLNKHELLAGLSYTYDRFQDNRSVGTHEYHIPAFYVQDIFSPSNKWDLMAGLRLDNHNVHGAILSPRVAASFYGMYHFIWKLSAGKGFRTFNLFSENHSAITSEVYYLQATDLLDEENSWSFTLNGQYAKTFNDNFSIAAEATAYHTRIDDYIQSVYKPEYTQDGRQKVEYQNLDGTMLTEGLEGVLTLGLPASLTLEAGANLFNFRTDGDVANGFIYFTPEYTALASVKWESEKADVHLGFDMNYVGPQLLREVRFGEQQILPERTSPSYAIFNAQIEKGVGPFTFSLSCQNIGNFFQAKEEPIFYSSGWYYQTTSVWGPMKGRTFYAGVRFNSGGFNSQSAHDESVPHDH